MKDKILIYFLLALIFLLVLILLNNKIEYFENNLDLTIVSHCHSDYLEVWPIYFDYLYKNGSTFKNVVCVNDKQKMDDFFNTREYKYQELIVYDEKIPFAQRMTYLLGQIKTKYVIYFADNMILLNCDTAKINDIVTWLDTNNYDSVQLIVDTANNLPNISITKDINVVEIKDSNYPFSFLPSIWNRESLLKASHLKPDASYREFEENLRYEYINTHCRVFRLNSMGQEKVKSWFNHMEPWFIYLQFLHRRQWVMPNTDLKDLHMNILEEYNINTNNLGIVNR